MSASATDEIGTITPQEWEDYADEVTHLPSSRARVPYVTVIIASRDGEATLPATLQSLRNQTIPVEIVVTDDHSLDSTPDILDKFGVTSIRYPRREPRNYHRVPHLYNLAWKYSPPSDYWMISGDDNVYPPDYVEKVIAHMNRAGVHIASGHNEHLRYLPTQAPTGSGRIISDEFMIQIMPLIEVTTWDSWILIKAHQLGYPAKAFPIAKRHLKERRIRINWGFGSHMSGVPMVFTLMRVFKQMFRTRRVLFPLSIFVGHAAYALARAPRLEYADYNNKLKRLQIRQNIKSLGSRFHAKFGLLESKK